MVNQSVELQARIYVYNLDNCANEYGFKADEGWEFSLASGVEKLALEKKYYPTLSTKVLPEVLSELLHMVKAKLVSGKSGPERKFDAQTKFDDNLQYLIAFNPKRQR